jgi:hypothetical protein
MCLRSPASLYAASETISRVMSQSGWKRLSARQRTQDAEALFEGVPSHLYLPLIGWCVDESGAGLLEGAAVAARLPLTDTLLGHSYDTDRKQAITGGLRGVGEQWPEKLLDLADALLHARYEQNPAVTTRVSVRRLNQLLEMGGSAWRVNRRGNGLERHVDQAVVATVNQAMTAAQQSVPSAGAHLAEAWAQAYGRAPDPTKVYSESIKAVEAASAPVVTPNDLKATLGKIVGEMKKAPGLWTLAIANASVEVAIQMMESLWTGQTDRHGGVSQTVPVTPSAAEAALHLAATLVHWFTVGAVAKK